MMINKEAQFKFKWLHWSNSNQLLRGWIVAPVEISEIMMEAFINQDTPVQAN